MKRVIHFIAMFLLGVTVMAKTETNDIGTVGAESQEILTDQNYQNESAMQPTCPYLDRVGGHYYLDGNPMSKKEYRNFLKNNSPEAWERYRKGTALWATGWSLFGVGMASACIVGPALLTSWFASGFEIGEYYLWSNSTAWEPGRRAGVIVSGVGLGLITASIPCIAVGAVKKFTAHNTYNEHCAKQQPQLQLSLQTSQNGIGLALNF